MGELSSVFAIVADNFLRCRFTGGFLRLKGLFAMSVSAKVFGYLREAELDARELKCADEASAKKLYELGVDAVDEIVEQGFQAKAIRVRRTVHMALELFSKSVLARLLVFGVTHERKKVREESAVCVLSICQDSNSLRKKVENRVRHLLSSLEDNPETWQHCWGAIEVCLLDKQIAWSVIDELLSVYLSAATFDLSWYQSRALSADALGIISSCEGSVDRKLLSHLKFAGERSVPAVADIYYYRASRPGKQVTQYLQENARRNCFYARRALREHEISW